MQAANSKDDRVRIERIIHTIHATENIQDCRRKYLDILGGLLFAESYFAAEDRDMALLYAANHMIEPMAPRDPSRDDMPFARYLKNYGQGFHSFELKVANGPEAAAHFKEAGCKLASEYGQFFFVREQSTGGVLLEVCELPMPNDPCERKGWNTDWSAGHPSGLARLDHIACVVANLQPVLHFFTELCNGEVVDDEQIELPQPARRILLQLGDTRVAFSQPDGPGVLNDSLAPPTSGIYALVWQVVDEHKAETFFHDRKLVTTREDCISSGFAIEPEYFLGARHEFIALR